MTTDEPDIDAVTPEAREDITRHPDGTVTHADSANRPGDGPDERPHTPRGETDAALADAVDAVSDADDGATVGEIVDYDRLGSERVRLRTADGDTLERATARVLHTAEDWARRIMRGDATVADAEPRIYQDVDADEFDEMVREALGRLESDAEDDAP